MPPARAPQPLPERGGGRAFGPPSSWPPGASRGTPSSRPRAPGARVGEACGARPGPSPRRGRGVGEGADGSNYGSDPPPPVARGRKTRCVRFPGREGRRPPRPTSRRRRGGGAGPGGDFLPPGTGLGRFPQERPSPTFSFPAPECFQARVPTSPAPADLKTPRIFRLGQWSRRGRGELYGCAGCDLNKGRVEGLKGI